MSWTYELTLLHGTTTMQVLEASLTLDVLWSPYGQASVTVPGAPLLDGPVSANPVTLRLTATDHDTAAATTHDLYLWQWSRERDHERGTTTFGLATADWLLRERYNSGAAWLPSGAFYEPSVVLRELVDRAGIPVEVLAIGTAADIPASAIVPWEPGQTAWDWWDGLRLAAGVVTQGALFGGPGPDARDVVTVEAWGGPPLATSTFWPTWQLLEHVQEFLPDEYADSVAMTYRYTDAAGEVQEVRETATANPRYTSRRHVEMSRDGEPIPGYTQRVANTRGAYLYKHELTLPMTYEIAAALALPDGVPASRLTFDFSDEPTVRATVFRGI